MSAEHGTRAVLAAMHHELSTAYLVMKACPQRSCWPRVDLSSSDTRPSRHTLSTYLK